MSHAIALKSPATRQDRLSIRTTAEEKSLVELAAQLTRTTMSRFVVQAAVRSAEEVLADQTRFALAPNQWDAFVTALDRSAREVPALKAVASKPSPFRDR